MRCGLNSCPSNTSALRNLPQFANSRLGSAPCCLVSALFGRLHTFYPGLSVPPPLLWPWRHGWVGLGCQFFSKSFRRRGERCLRLMLHLGRGSQAAVGSVLMHGVQALPGHRISLLKAGAACCCWLGTWPHDPCRGTACYCWLGPCPNDPLRCGLNSSHSAFLSSI